jgi:hypothetical protein
MFLKIKGVIVAVTADFSLLKGRKNMNTHKWIVTIALVLALAMQAAPVSAQSPATSVTLSLPTPHPGVIFTDLSFTLGLDVANIVPGVAGIDVFVAFNTFFIGLNPSVSVVEQLPDFFGPSMVTSVTTFDFGTCPVGPAGTSCIHLVAAGPAQSTRSGAIARFHFFPDSITAPGTTTCFSVLSIQMVDSNGNTVATPPALPAPQCTPIIDNSVVGIVLRQGTPAAAPNAGGGTLACSFVKALPGGVLNVFNSVNTNAPMGDFSIFPFMPPIVTTLRAEYPGYLPSQKVITVSTTGPVNAGTTTLRGGDINGDNRINILDVGILLPNFGVVGVDVRSDAAGGCGDGDQPADINDDGTIDIRDIAIIAGTNFGLVGPTPWQ